MGYLNQKNAEKLHADVVGIITEKLLSGFRNRKFEPVVEVEYVNVKYKIDDDESDNDVIVLKSITATARVLVLTRIDDARSKNQIDVSINKPIILSLNKDSKEYEINNPEQIALTDMS